MQTIVAKLNWQREVSRTITKDRGGIMSAYIEANDDGYLIFRADNDTELFRMHERAFRRAPLSCGCTHNGSTVCHDHYRDLCASEALCPTL